VNKSVIQIEEQWSALGRHCQRVAVVSNCWRSI